MLGEYIDDPDHVESSLGRINGIDLLSVRTKIVKEKTTSQIRAKIHPSNGLFENSGELKGYEIHMGRTVSEKERPLFEIFERGRTPVSISDGAISEDGRVWGTYVHGIFDNDPFRREFIRRIGKTKGLAIALENEVGDRIPFNYRESKEAHYDKLAALVRENVDMDAFCRIAGLR